MDQGRSAPACPASTKRIATGLFLAFLTVQSAFIVLAPTLPEIAREFGVSVGTAGQLRTVAALAGVAAAVALITRGRNAGMRRLLVAGLLALAGGAVISALAPTFALLAAGQAVLGAGGAATLSAGLAAAVDWPPPEQRSRVLAWTIVGQPAAWVAGLPVVGLLSELGWRWGWAVVPAAAVAALAVLPCGRMRNAAVAAGVSGSVLRDRRVRGWAFGELMAYAGWGGTLVYAGALIAESYGLGTHTVGLLLGGAAIAYFPGTFAVRSRLEGDLRTLLARLALALAAGTVVFGMVRPSAVVTTVLFGALVLLAGARGIAGSAFGLNAAPAEKVTIGGIRSGATQLGYLLGAAGGGIALDQGGYGALGLTLAAFFGAAAVPHLGLGARGAARRAQRALDPIYAEWSRGNWRARQPEFAWGFSSEFPGSDGIRPDPGPRSERFAEWLRQWSDWRVEAERFIGTPCRVVVMTRYRGHGRTSGVAIDSEGAHVWTLEDGRPVTLEVFADRELALEAGSDPCAD